MPDEKPEEKAAPPPTQWEAGPPTQWLDGGPPQEQAKKKKKKNRGWQSQCPERGHVTRKWRRCEGCGEPFCRDCISTDTGHDCLWWQNAR